MPLLSRRGSLDDVSGVDRDCHSISISRGEAIPTQRWPECAVESSRNPCFMDGDRTRLIPRIFPVESESIRVTITGTRAFRSDAA